MRNRNRKKGWKERSHQVGALEESLGISAVHGKCFFGSCPAIGGKHVSPGLPALEVFVIRTIVAHRGCQPVSHLGRGELRLVGPKPLFLFPFFFFK